MTQFIATTKKFLGFDSDITLHFEWGRWETCGTVTNGKEVTMAYRSGLVSVGAKYVFTQEEIKIANDLVSEVMSKVKEHGNVATLKKEFLNK